MRLTLEEIFELAISRFGEMYRASIAEHVRADFDRSLEQYERRTSETPMLTAKEQEEYCANVLGWLPDDQQSYA